MDLPWFKFHTQDWLSNPSLKRCSHAEKGIWIDVLCLMHDSSEYGILRWPLKEIAQAVGCSVAALKGLVAKGVLKGADPKNKCEALEFTPVSGRKKGPTVVLIAEQEGAIWYSSRMVIDEYKRNVRGGNNDGFGDPPNHAPKPPFGEGIDAHQTHHHSRAISRESESESELETNHSVVESVVAQPVVVSANDRQAKKGQTFIADDFEPTPANTHEANKLGLDLPTELAKFKAHHASKGTASYDWGAEFHKWLLTAHGFAADRAREAKPPSSRKPSYDDGQKRDYGIGGLI